MITWLKIATILSKTGNKIKCNTLDILCLACTVFWKNCFFKEVNLRMTDPIYFYNSDFHEILCQLLIKIYQNQSKK